MNAQTLLTCLALLLCPTLAPGMTLPAPAAALTPPAPPARATLPAVAAPSARPLPAALPLPLPAPATLVPAQDPADAQPASPQEPLPPGAVASLDGELVSEAAFVNYLGSAFARQPEGHQALQQLFVEALLAQEASARGLVVDLELTKALFDRYEAQARAASGGATGLLENAGGPAAADLLEATLRLAALQRVIVAHEDGVDDPLDVTDARLSAWLTEAQERCELSERRPNDSVAASWTGGEIPRSVVGLRLMRMLPPEVVSGVLTELLGIVAISRVAAARGIEFSTDAAVAELTERERLVTSTPAATGISYEEYLLQTEGLSIEELLASPGFRAEVLMVALVDADWDAAQLALLFEELREPLAERFGPDVTLDQALPTLLKEARQRAYRDVLGSVTIVRRF